MGGLATLSRRQRRFESGRGRQIFPKPLKSNCRRWISGLSVHVRVHRWLQRLAIPYIGETNRVIQLAERGNWPPIGDDETEALALGWWEWFKGEPIKRWVDRCG